MADVPAYVLPAELRAVIGVPNGQDARVAACCVLGSVWLDHYLGAVEPVIPEYDDAAAIVRAAGTTYPLQHGALLLAERLYRSPDVPFGVAGGLGDLAVRVYSLSVPEAELAALGLRQSWGIA